MCQIIHYASIYSFVGKRMVSYFQQMVAQRIKGEISSQKKAREESQRKKRKWSRSGPQLFQLHRLRRKFELTE